MIFDFFGTLTESVPASERDADHARVAAALGVPVGAYQAALKASWRDRATGRLGDLAATMRWLAEASGAVVDDRTVAAACEIRHTTQQGYLRLRPEAEPTLRELRNNGFRIGLVSDCTHELPAHWPDLPVAPLVDAPVFSVDVGLKKPDPAIYALVCERLDVDPEECVYVGDGDSNELHGAEAAGMRPLRLLAPDHAGGHVMDEITWTGASITSLAQVFSR